MKVLITGATGLIGKEIVKQCHAIGITVHYLTTSKNKINTQENYKGFYWNPNENQIDVSCFNGVEVIINLAGASIAERWTKKHKQNIIDSRLNALKLLKSTIVNKKLEIKHLISASAIGIYPNSLTNYYDETFKEISNTFLGDVASQWESAATEFEDLGILVAKIRIGLVLDKNEGALPQIAKPIRYGLGAAFGCGEQWQSWIHINDIASLFMYVLKYQLKGIFNGVAPNAITNSELTKAVAKTLNMPLILPKIPRVLMQLSLGDMSALLYESQRVSSKKVENSGFNFKYHHLQPALDALFED